MNREGKKGTRAKQRGGRNHRTRKEKKERSRSENKKIVDAVFLLFSEKEESKGLAKKTKDKNVTAYETKNDMTAV